MDLLFLPPGPDGWLALAAVLPALLAALMLALGRRAVPVVPVVAIAVLLPLAAWLAVAALRQGVVTTNLGGWERPLGIVLRLDGLAAVFILATAAVAAGVSVHALAGFRHPARGEARIAYGFWPLLLFLWTGLNVTFLSHDLFNIYVALEVTSLSGVALVALQGGAAALAAQMRYLLFAGLGSLLYLMGVALLYGQTGALDLGLVADRIDGSPPVVAALLLTTFGLLVKSAVWPLHFWLPDAHASAPSPVSAVLSGLVVKASLYVLIRLWFEVFAPLLDATAWAFPGVLGGIAVLWGSVMALRQDRLKLMIAYSTVAQLGYMLFVFPLAATGGPFAAQAWTGAILLMLSHAVAKASMFLAAGAIMATLGDDRRATLGGASRLVPVPILALALAGLSIMALPPSGGFLGKWMMLRAAIGAADWWLSGVLVAGGLLAAAYVFRFLLPAFRPVPEGTPDTPHHSGPMAHGALALAALSLLLGLAPLPVIRLIEGAIPASVGILP